MSNSGLLAVLDMKAVDRAFTPKVIKRHKAFIAYYGNSPKDGYVGCGQTKAVALADLKKHWGK